MDIRVSKFKESEREIRIVRSAVFGLEQGIPEELNWDGKDEVCMHAIAISEDGQPVGTGRISPDGKIGRMAVCSSHRGQGIGTRVLDALIEAAANQGLKKVFLHSQLSAKEFYEKNGFVTDGKVFLEAGIEHVIMDKRT